MGLLMNKEQKYSNPEKNEGPL